jgi:hypothetical protein
MPWAGIVDKSFNPADFTNYCKSLTWATWRPSFIVLHNTGVPNLAQRPNGLTQQQILNLQSYYRDQQGWSAGPHLFVDDLQIWAFTPLTVPGVHSPSWNQLSIGIEMLGDYQTDEFDTGRGMKIRDNAVSAMASVSSVLGLDPTTMKLHHEDPQTTHRDCPGKNVMKPDIIMRVQAALASLHAGDHDPQANGP